jgi:hypothetical protein
MWWNGGLLRDGERWTAAALARASESPHWLMAATAYLWDRTHLGPPDQDEFADRLESLAVRASDDERREVNHSLVSYHGSGRLRTVRARALSERVLGQQVDPVFPARDGAILGDPTFEPELTNWAWSIRYEDPERVQDELSESIRLLEESFTASVLRQIRGSVLADLGRFDEADRCLNRP